MGVEIFPPLDQSATYVTVTGNQSITGTKTFALLVASPGIDSVPLIIRRGTDTSPTAKLLDIQNAAGTTLSFFEPDGALSLPAATTANASLNVPHGAAPTSPTNGDVWTTTSGAYVRINGATVGPLGSGGGGGTPATTVTTLTGLQTAVVGTATNYAREDHKHAVTGVVDTSTLQTVGGIKNFSAYQITVGSNGTGASTAQFILLGTDNATVRATTLDFASNSSTRWSLYTNGYTTVDDNFHLFYQPNSADALSVSPTTGLTVAKGISVSSASATATVTITDTGSNGSNLKFVGNGGTTPNKTIRAQGGNLEIINSAYGAVVAVVSDAGALTLSSTISASGLAGSLLSASSGAAVGTAAAGSSAIPARSDHVHGITSGVTITGGNTVHAASTTGYASLNIPNGTAPTTPAAGDVWSDSTGLWASAGVGSNPRRIPAVTFMRCTTTTSAATTGSYVTPTGFSAVPVKTGRTYYFRIVAWTSVGATTYAPRPRINYPTITQGSAQTWQFTNTTAVSVGTQNATLSGTSATLVLTVAATTSALPFTMDGFIVPSADGNFSFDFTPNSAGTVSVFAGSFMRVEEVG